MEEESVEVDQAVVNNIQQLEISSPGTEDKKVSETQEKKETGDCIQTKTTAQNDGEESIAEEMISS